MTEMASECSPYSLYVTTGSGSGLVLVEETLCVHSPQGYYLTHPTPFPNEDAEFAGKNFKIAILSVGFAAGFFCCCFLFV